MLRLLFNRTALSAVGLSLFIFAYSSAHADEAMSHDGLALTEKTKSHAIYMKPGASLSQYTKFELVDLFISFKKDWQKNINHTVSLESRVSKNDMEKIKARLNTLFNQRFAQQLEKDGLEKASGSGDDVLIIRPAIIDLNITAPDLMRADQDTYVHSAGSMTMYVELYDSESNSIIARIIDAEAGRYWPDMFRATRVTNNQQADEIIRKWADMLAGLIQPVKSQ